ncbi:MAG: hypothetical protein GY820_46215, partial [Gammaproteobacteria bacterium]|nr:hypothetical protein [Gammaproteobacteria bacterium]
MAKPLTVAAYHAKVIRQMLHYFGRVWTGIIDARHDLAYRKNETIWEEPMTVEEREKFDSTPARYILPPQELFSPQDKPVERTNWWLEITGQAILEATTDDNRGNEKYRIREKEQGRISALEDHVIEVALAHGGQVHKLSEELMTEIDILKVTEAEAKLATQSAHSSTSQSYSGTNQHDPHDKMDTTEKDAAFPPLAKALETENLPQKKKSSGKSSRASSTESRSSGKGLMASLKQVFTAKPQIPIMQLKEADVAPRGEQPLPGLRTIKESKSSSASTPHTIVKPIP